LSKNLNLFEHGARRGPEVDEHHLVFIVMDKSTQEFSQLDEFPSIQLAQEHAVLNVISKILACLEDLRSPLVVGDVIRNHEIVSVGDSAHRVTIPM
jgi:hypothetical protein